MNVEIYHHTAGETETVENVVEVSRDGLTIVVECEGNTKRFDSNTSMIGGVTQD